MQKLLIALFAVTSLFATAGVATAKSSLSPAYQAVYCYPTGSYWQAQVSAYPQYYAKHDAQYTKSYGANTQYCK